MFCPFHPELRGACDCILQLEGDTGMNMVHTESVSFYPCSSLVRLRGRIYHFPYASCRSLLVTAAMPGRVGPLVFHRCINRDRRNLYVVFQCVDPNGFRFGIGYMLDVIRGGRTVLTHLRCAQRAVRAFLGRRRQARALAAAMHIPLPPDLIRLCLPGA
jgi:hypothetical protein